MDINYLYKCIMRHNDPNRGPWHAQVFNNGVSNLVFVNYVSFNDLLLTADDDDIRIIDEHLRSIFYGNLLDALNTEKEYFFTVGTFCDDWFFVYIRGDKYFRYDYS